MCGSRESLYLGFLNKSKPKEAQKYTKFESGLPKIATTCIIYGMDILLSI
jgi:hypothetical protein